MAKKTPKVTPKKPKNVFTKPLKADFKELFTALSKGIGHTVFGKWEEIGADTTEACLQSASPPIRGNWRSCSSNGP